MVACFFLISKYLTLTFAKKAYNINHKSCICNYCSILTYEKQPYHLNRTKVTSLNFNEADDHVNYWAEKTEDERLDAACFIINQIFGVTPQTKVDRTVTDKRKHS